MKVLRAKIYIHINMASSQPGRNEHGTIFVDSSGNRSGIRIMRDGNTLFETSPFYLETFLQWLSDNKVFIDSE